MDSSYTLRIRHLLTSNITVNKAIQMLFSYLLIFKQKKGKKKTPDNA